MSYPQLIVYALKMRRRMGFKVPVGTIALLKAAWDVPTMGDFDEKRVTWVTQLSQELRDPMSSQGSTGWQVLRSLGI